jgi:hypothetical protein
MVSPKSSWMHLLILMRPVCINPWTSTIWTICSSISFDQAVAAHLSLYKFTLKTSPPSRFNPNNVTPIPEKLKIKALEESSEWNTGCIYAQAQNLARTVRCCFIVL